MKKKNIKWKISDLSKYNKLIEFPEFQREPSVWDIDKKQKLIDSILRNFDIANIYLYKRSDGYYDCIDGRQRINAILSFLGLNNNKNDDGELNFDNDFKFSSSDELLGRESLQKYNGKGYKSFDNNMKQKILNYEFNIIEISDIPIENSQELNLMFLRLQLGSPLNAGEKLNAMVGEMKDFVFKKLGKHKFIKLFQIPQRRFSGELTASQIAVNFYSLKKTKSYQRARFIDLQDFFREHVVMSPGDKAIMIELEKKMNTMHAEIYNKIKMDLKNRAIGITLFLFLNKLIDENKEKEIKNFLSFFIEFSKRLKEQVKKGIYIDPEYRDLLKFQTYISQAAVEKYAVENRQIFLEDYFAYYKKYNKIKGDK
jgi:hypothetical protein